MGIATGLVAWQNTIMSLNHNLCFSGSDEFASSSAIIMYEAPVRIIGE